MRNQRRYEWDPKTVRAQSVAGSEVDDHSVPWRAIYSFIVESADIADLDRGMKVWASSQTERTCAASGGHFAIQSLVAGTCLMWDEVGQEPCGMRPLRPPASWRGLALRAPRT